MKRVSVREIVEAHSITEVRVFGTRVLVNNKFSYHYSDKKIAEEVAKKVNMFVGLK